MGLALGAAAMLPQPLRAQVVPAPDIIDEMTADGALFVPAVAAPPEPAGEWDWSAPARDLYAGGGGMAGRPERRVNLVNDHTGEKLDLLYVRGGRPVSDAIAAVSHFFRDWRTGTVKTVDVRMLDVLNALQARSGGRPLHLLSGYRTPETNAMLARQMRGVAPHSLHMQAKAADIHQPGGDLAQLHAAALALRAGGVGYYPHNGFIHVDSGPVRSWVMA